MSNDLEEAISEAAASTENVWCIVVAGGSGARFGAPKQFEDLAGRRIVDRSVDAALAAGVDGVVLVVPESHVGAESEQGHGVFVQSGGSTRSESVRAGLAAVPSEADVIVVHDAARPLAPPSLFQRAAAAVRSGADGAIPGVPVTDTVKELAGDPVGGLLGAPVGRTLDRSRLFTVQTPQAFDAGALRRAHEGSPEATDDAALVEAVGGKVVFVPGELTNIKITHPHDLAVASAYLAATTERRSSAR